MFFLYRACCSEVWVIKDAVVLSLAFWASFRLRETFADDLDFVEE